MRSKENLLSRCVIGETNVRQLNIWIDNIVPLTYVRLLCLINKQKSEIQSAVLFSRVKLSLKQLLCFYLSSLLDLNHPQTLSCSLIQSVETPVLSYVVIIKAYSLNQRLCSIPLSHDLFFPV